MARLVMESPSSWRRVQVRWDDTTGELVVTVPEAGSLHLLLGEAKALVGRLDSTIAQVDVDAEFPERDLLGFEMRVLAARRHLRSVGSKRGGLR